VPGDTVAMRNNILILNDKPVEYTQINSEYTEYLPARMKQRCAFAMEDLDGITYPVMSIPSVPAIRSFGPFTVPDGCYFVLGDNRDASKDSRMFGFVERKLIVGRAIGIIGSFDITDKYQPRFKRFFAPVK
jgi:signal peptidase I